MIANNVEANQGLLGIRNASFTWSNEVQWPCTPCSSRRNFTLRIDDELVFMEGKINLIVGPTGSGKTSLLMALLGISKFCL
jgi:AAA15 family ATPase/GTPase